MPGYIYIRDNKWFKSENVYKVGITSTSIIDRSSSYITGEIYKGIYVKIYEFDVNKEKLRIIDNLLKREFNHLNIYFDGGTEFYDRIIIDNIEAFFNKYNLKFAKYVESGFCFRKRIAHKNDINMRIRTTGKNESLN